MQTIGVVYPGSINHDLPVLNDLKPRCTTGLAYTADRATITCDGLPILNKNE